MAGFYRTFSMLLHLCEIAEILQVFPKLSPDSKKSQGVVCRIFSKKKDHGICGLYHQTTTPGGICHGHEELYRIGI